MCAEDVAEELFGDFEALGEEGVGEWFGTGSGHGDGELGEGIRGEGEEVVWEDGTGVYRYMYM